MITILSASWGNEDKSSAIVKTVERGHKAISAHTPEEWADFIAWRLAGNPVRALEDGAAFKAALERKAEQAALRSSATSKLASLGITPEELRAVMGTE